MKNAIEQLREKEGRHLDKLKQHNDIKETLENEYKLLAEGNSRKKRVAEQLESTLKSIEYHTITAKTYQKAIKIVQA